MLPTILQTLLRTRTLLTLEVSHGVKFQFLFLVQSSALSPHPQRSRLGFLPQQNPFDFAGSLLAPKARVSGRCKTPAQQSSLARIVRCRNHHSMASLDPLVPPAVNAAPTTSAPRNLSSVEASKRRAAYKAVEDHFDTSYKYIGIGSGSTVVYVVEAIVAKGREITSKMAFIPTGDQSKQLIIEAGLPLGSIDALPPVEVSHSKLGGDDALHVGTGKQDLGLKGKRQSLDVAFDGADEIDEELNCIKGGGACLFQEKLVATSARKFVCVAGKRS
jgi:hypothetical protein